MTTSPTPAPAQEGRQLDAKMAVQFFGWRWVNNPLSPRDAALMSPEETAGYRPCRFIDGPPVGWRGHYSSYMPHYSTDPTAALQVIDKLQGSGLYVVINTTCDKGLYDVDVMDGVHFMSRGCVAFEQFAKGVCLAAPKAVESFADRAAKGEA